MLTPATIEILAASAAAGRFARGTRNGADHPAGQETPVRHSPRLLQVRAHAGIWRWIPELLLSAAGGPC